MEQSSKKFIPNENIEKLQDTINALKKQQEMNIDENIKNQITMELIQLEDYMKLEISNMSSELIEKNVIVKKEYVDNVFGLVLPFHLKRFLNVPSVNKIQKDLNF
jgi:hypothetical protein